MASAPPSLVPTMAAAARPIPTPANRSATAVASRTTSPDSRSSTASSAGSSDAQQASPLEQPVAAHDDPCVVAGMVRNRNGR